MPIKKISNTGIHKHRLCALLSTALISAIFISGCSSNPLGIDDDTWQTMTPSEHLDAHKAQAQLDEAAYHAATEQRKAELAAQAEQQRIREEIRQNARYGDLVQCVLNPVSYFKGKSWLALQPLGFELVRGDTATVELKSAKGMSLSLYATLDQSGQNLSVCRYASSGYGSSSGYKDYSNCAVLASTAKRLAKGVSQHIELKEWLRAKLHCDLKPTYGMPAYRNSGPVRLPQ